MFMKRKEMIPSLTDQEESVMRIVWQLRQSCTVRDVLNTMESPLPPYTTLASVFKNLESKGYLKSHLDGKTRIYDIVIKESSYTRGALGRFVQDFFGGNYSNLVHQFAKEEKISPEELRHLLDMIDHSSDNK